MAGGLAPRVVVASRPTEWDQLLGAPRHRGAGGLLPGDADRSTTSARAPARCRARTTPCPWCRRSSPRRGAGPASIGPTSPGSSSNPGHRGGGRPGRPGPQRRQVPRRAAGDRRQSRSRTPRGRPRALRGREHRRRHRGRPRRTGGHRGSNHGRGGPGRRAQTARPQRGVRRAPLPPVGPLRPARCPASTNGNRPPE